MEAIGNLIPHRTETRYCPKHGDYTATILTIGGEEKPGGGCPQCLAEHDRAEAEQQRQQDIAERKQRRIDNKMRRAAIPRRFADRRLSNYRAENEGQRRALASATRYADQFDDALDNGTNLILAGTPGTGKTHLAIGIAWQVMDAGHTAAFTTTMDAIRRVRETYSRDSRETERQALESLSQPDLLILDEVGVQLGTEAERMTLFEILNRRYQDMRPTILISNLSLDGIEEYLGQRGMDRMREGGGRAVVFDWGSYRRGAA
ncbi:MAG: ATP-binding protein [Phycisphaerae bacterium]